ncbi:C45 family autoproteolytic acyltransferase/hydolase [Glaciibacter psychrotolerans]|uniref:Isopenicillin-N N-acyltransferase-like protein n=1 Tax=Glaciibacter psychrotolerans TaxID=670054 RepID=A0A7Z0EGJ9_9MICO|nr:C45 family peptidase [Leifsonia psychrotolerans]NYJ20519.1 isopenicillin-N N-acyltransferase-like protein [Leifsonia psychrotolerans]
MTDTIPLRPAAQMEGVPVLELRGSAFERGQQYGRQAKERILRSRAAYAEVYAHFARWDWDQVLAESALFVEPIRAFGPQYLEEMRGIAVGSGLDFLDVLALNLRTEILFAARAREPGASVPSVGECTAFADSGSADGQLLGQNWDWMPFAADTIVLIDAVPDDGPRWMTVVEAGLLAKFGMNSAGLAVTTNALVTSGDAGEPGVPYHVMLRALLDSTSADDAVATLSRATRSSSANYMIAARDGWAIDAESRPGGADRITWSTPRHAEPLLHANHFSDTVPFPADVTDVGLRVMPDSPHRLRRAADLSAGAAGPAARDLNWWKQSLADHEGFPDSLCCHPNPDSHPMDQGATVTGVIFDPAKSLVHLTIGPPCSSTWQVIDFSTAFESDLQ